MLPSHSLSRPKQSGRPADGHDPGQSCAQSKTHYVTLTTGCMPVSSSVPQTAELQKLGLSTGTVEKYIPISSSLKSRSNPESLQSYITEQQQEGGVKDPFDNNAPALMNNKCMG